MLTVVTIAGMRSVHCVRAVFTALAAVPGIATADVRMGRAELTHDGQATEAALRDAIAVAGYTVTAVRHDRRRLL